jgi:hypothetical protein
MKISYSNYPILYSINKKQLHSVKIMESDKGFFDVYKNDFKQHWDKNSSEYAVNINIVSRPFYDGVLMAWDKLILMYANDANDNKKDILIRSTNVVGNWVSCLYYKIDKSKELIDYTWFVFHKSGTPLSYAVSDSENGLSQLWICNQIRKEYNIVTDIEANSWFERHIMADVFIDYFKKYANIETIEVNSNKIHKDINCKYVNQTLDNLTFLDSKWFTNIVKSESFKVRGFFRLQPKKKNGEWIKELIWIDEFVKHGYTSKARKLNINGCDSNQ